jgi:hypothetical protein
MSLPMSDTLKIVVVVIGRNEGQRPVGCLNSVDPKKNVVVYVDSNSNSNSTDNSVEIARGAVALNLDMT